jgi:galactokinase
MLAAQSGDWANYVKSAVLRFRLATDLPLQGMDMMVGGNIPVAAGLSSSSSIVVATAEALTALNSLNLTEREFVELCGEGEWFVGSRGGAGDHAAMKCSRAGCVTHLDFKPFKVGRAAALPASCAVIVANSLEQSKKAEGSRDIFNARVAAYELAFLLVKKNFPDRALDVFRDLALIRPVSDLCGMLASLPEKATRAEIAAALKLEDDKLAFLYADTAPTSIDENSIVIPYTKEQYLSFPRKRKKSILTNVRAMTEYRDVRNSLNELLKENSANASVAERIRRLEENLAECEKALPKTPLWDECVQRLKK